MAVGKRRLIRVLTAAFNPVHYRALVGMARVYPHPFAGFWRYVSKSGTYPTEFPLRTPIGVVAPTLYVADDMVTVNEVFCRLDYACSPDIRTFVDFGANIGISALFFLTRNPECRGYLVEPLAMNLERLRPNLAAFADRWRLFDCAVALATGEAEFGWEPTGRYGGIGLDRANTVTAPTREVNEILREILAERDQIDVLKVDIESMEKPVIEAIDPVLRDRIGLILAETTYAQSPFPSHALRQRGNLARLVRRG